MNKTLILTSIENGIALHLGKDKMVGNQPIGIETELATFTHGNLQRAMMFAAIRTSATLSMGTDIELRLTVADAESLIKFYNMLGSPTGIEVMIKLACEKRIEQGEDATAVKLIEG